jgi:hypothetical protein
MKFFHSKPILQICKNVCRSCPKYLFHFLVNFFYLVPYLIKIKIHQGQNKAKSSKKAAKLTVEQLLDHVINISQLN